MISILLKISLTIIVLLAFYKIFLEKESFFLINRFFLLSTLGFAFALPFITLPDLHKYQGIVAQKLEFFDPQKSTPPEFDASDKQEYHSQTTPAIKNPDRVSNQDQAVIQPEKQDLSIAVESSSDEKQSADPGYVPWLYWFYFFGVAILSLRLLTQIAQMLWKIFKAKDRILDEKVVIVGLEDEIEPCSFFNFIFINPARYDLETYEQIITHEKIHVRQWHTIDLLLSEFAVIILWFNPFIWLLRKEIEKNLEFQTDDLMLNRHKLNKEKYQLSLVRIVNNTQPPSITTNYNQSLIKKRILKMNAKKSNPGNYWKYAFIAPITFFLLLFLNAPQQLTAQSELNEGAISENDCEALSRAIHEENVGQVKSLLKTVEPNCIQPDPRKMGGFHKESYVQLVHTPLSAAAKVGNLEIASLLLDIGAKIDSHDVYMKSPLMAASEAGQLSMVKYLIERGANIQAISGNHGAALHCAVKGGHIEIVRYLLEQGADINAYTYFSGTPISYAAKLGQNEIVSFLIEKGANLENPRSALSSAAGKGKLETIELLLSKGAQIDYPNDYGWSPLYMAAWWGRDTVVDFLLSKGAQINLENSDRGTALIAAALNGHVETARLLLSKGAMPDMRCEQYGTALIAAALEGYTDLAELLLSNGAQVDLQTFAPSSGLSKPARLGPGIIPFRSNIDRQSGAQLTALMAAARHNRAETVALLLSKGASINLQTFEQGSALIVAARNGSLKTAELLLSSGADINLQNEQHGTALTAAAKNGHTKTVRFLLSSGAELNTINEKQGSPLIAAARNGHTKTVELLLSEGADINLQNDLQGTALNAAARNGHLETVKVLVSNGADIHLVNKNEGTALDAAYRNANLDVINYLESIGAKRSNDN